MTAISIPDMDAWKAAVKGEWLSAWDIWPYGFPRREYRAERLVKVGLAEKRMLGAIEQYLVRSQF